MTLSRDTFFYCKSCGYEFIFIISTNQQSQHRNRTISVMDNNSNTNHLPPFLHDNMSPRIVQGHLMMTFSITNDLANVIYMILVDLRLVWIFDWGSVLNPQVDSPPFSATVGAPALLQLYQEDPVHKPLGLRTHSCSAQQRSWKKSLGNLGTWKL